MGLYDRDYSQDGNRRGFGNAPQMRMSFPKLTLMVKRLLIINAVVFFSGILIKPVGLFLYEWFQIDATSLGRALQIWRLITYQFLHDPVRISHIIFNMLGLYFLGPTLERHWGSKRFIYFYLGCGVAGGLFYLFLVAINFLPIGTMIGASGAILGMLAACAILFPHFIVFIFLFPVPIRVAAIAAAAFYVFLVVTKSANAGGDAAHLAGMVAGALYVLSGSWQTKLRSKIHTRDQQKDMQYQQDLQAEVDRILQKVHEHGIQSLTGKEKKILKYATKLEQTRKF